MFFFLNVFFYIVTIQKVPSSLADMKQILQLIQTDIWALAIHFYFPSLI